MTGKPFNTEKMTLYEIGDTPRNTDGGDSEVSIELELQSAKNDNSIGGFDIGLDIDVNLDVKPNLNVNVELSVEHDVEIGVDVDLIPQDEIVIEASID